MTFKNINYIKPDKDLAKIVGEDEEPYPAKLKKLWVYMKSHGLVIKRSNPCAV